MKPNCWMRRSAAIAIKVVVMHASRHTGVPHMVLLIRLGANGAAVLRDQGKVHLCAA